MDTSVRSDRELFAATTPFTQENRALSWWYTISSMILLAAATAVAALAPWWPLRLAASFVEGLLIIRGFILYHDFLHRALLRGSSAAKWVFYPFGVLVLTPPAVWKQTHNYHHAHTAKLVGSHVGSYAMVSTDMWAAMTWREKFLYKLMRHPLTIALGYLTIFLWGMCASSFIRNPRKNWDSLLALIVHVALAATLFKLFGFAMMIYVLVFPLMVACALGGYLFYAQHNFEGLHVQPRESWNYTRAALESSSFLKMGRLMSWFTGDIGYHHVHHLNPSIPFYRLREAMAAIPELQHPVAITMHPRDIVASFRLKLWDPKLQRMVGFRGERSHVLQPR